MDDKASVSGIKSILSYLVELLFACFGIQDVFSVRQQLSCSSRKAETNVFS